MSKIRKFFDELSWPIRMIIWLIAATEALVTIKDSVATNAKDIATLQQLHADENLVIRMATQEQMSKDTHEQLVRIEDVQGKIFDRINQIADRTKQ